MSAAAAQILENAADWLLVNGRCRDSLTGPHGEGCVMFAMADGLETFPPPEARYLAERSLDRHLWTQGHLGLVSWNRDTEDDGEIRDTLLLVAKSLRSAVVPA